ncbi:hypothetical protein BCD48_29145 [Pseudofrankia sp. BMG5.36]|nr:hypothetical protein BCD48_29145 [Pseudofrankia sp. BMG5.36]
MRHHGDTPSEPDETSPTNVDQGVQYASATSSGLSWKGSDVVAEKTGQISFSTVPSSITER